VTQLIRCSWKRNFVIHIHQTRWSEAPITHI